MFGYLRVGLALDGWLLCDKGELHGGESLQGIAERRGEKECRGVEVPVP